MLPASRYWPFARRSVSFWVSTERHSASILPFAGGARCGFQGADFDFLAVSSLRLHPDFLAHSIAIFIALE